MTAPVVLPAATRVAVPWKDGGGITRTIATGPDGAGMDDFDWRLSMAAVSAAGPFSRFDGVERTLAVLEGTLELDIAGRTHRIDADRAPVTFAGDASVTGTPIGGTAIDLNLMVRRGRASGRLIGLAPAFVPDPAASALILLFTAAGTLDRGGVRLAVERYDAIRLDPATWTGTVVTTNGSVVLAEIAEAA